MFALVAATCPRHVARRQGTVLCARRQGTVLCLENLAQLCCAVRRKGERWERCLWQIKRPERVAAVDKIEDKRKPEDFIGHRNRTRLHFHSPQGMKIKVRRPRAVGGNSPPDCCELIFRVPRRIKIWGRQKPSPYFCIRANILIETPRGCKFPILGGAYFIRQGAHFTERVQIIPPGCNSGYQPYLDKRYMHHSMATNQNIGGCALFVIYIELF